MRLVSTQSHSLRPSILSGQVKGSSSSRSAGKLNLVSLMDIFTILVFFLMVNTGDVEVLQADEAIALPKSHAALKPDEAPVIKLNAEGLYFREQELMAAEKLVESGELVQPLYEQLTAFKAELAASSTGAESAKGVVSIMGDQSVPYQQLKKILHTCAQAGFRDVALAVEYSSRVNPELALGGATRPGVLQRGGA